MMLGVHVVTRCDSVTSRRDCVITVHTMMLGVHVVTRCDIVTSRRDCAIIIMCHMAQTSLLSAVEIAIYSCVLCVISDTSKQTVAPAVLFHRTNLFHSIAAAVGM